nr:integrase, catalytic region, zinc finger, CCHC-type, peptidase aspartic, catalytic [Tanacetum cinerariifolium]
MDINIDALYNILKQNQGDVNDAMGYMKKACVVTSDPLALVAKKTKVSKCKEKVVVQSESEGSDNEDISDLKKITALLAKAFNQKKYYVKPTNNNLRTSSASSSANKKPEYVKKEDKKADEKKRDMSKVKCYNCKKGHFVKDCKKAKVKDYNYYKIKMLLAKKDSDEQVLLAEDQAWMKSSSDSDQEINANMDFMAKIEKVLLDLEESSSFAEETIAEVSYYTSDSKSESEYETSEYYDNSTNYGLFVDNDDDQDIFHDAIEFASENFNENHIVSQTDHDQSKVYHNDSEEKDHLVDKLIKKKKIDEQEILFDKMSRQLVEMNNNVLRLQEKILEKETKILESEECVRNKDLEIEKCLERLNDCENKLHKIGQTHQKIHMIMPSKDKLYNGRKGIEIINPDFEKIDSPFQQTSSLKPYVPTVILEKIIIDLEDEVVSLLEKEKENLEIIESLKSKGFESSDNEISESENQSENDCQEVEKDTRSAYACNDAMNVFCNSRLYDSCNVNDLFVYDDIVQICLWIIDSRCSKHMTGNRALLTNFVKKFLGTVRFGNNDFAVIAGYGDVVIGLMTIKKVYYVEDDVGKLKAKADIRVFVGYSKESAAFRVYNKRTQKIYESVNVNFDEISEMASKQFRLEPGLSNLNETRKSSNPTISQVLEISNKDLEDLFHNFYDEYFDSSKMTQSLTTNVETSNNEISSHEEVFHESSESFQEESSSSSLNDDVQQSSEEVMVPPTNTQSILNNMVPNVNEASSSHNVFNKRLKDTNFDASTTFHDPSNAQRFYQPYPHEKKWTKDHPLHKIIGDPKSCVRTRGQLENSSLFACLLSSIVTPLNLQRNRISLWGATS